MLANCALSLAFFLVQTSYPVSVCNSVTNLCFTGIPELVLNSFISFEHGSWLDPSVFWDILPDRAEVICIIRSTEIIPTDINYSVLDYCNSLLVALK